MLFSARFVGYVAWQAFKIDPINFAAKRQYNSLSKHFFADAGLNLTQEGLQPSRVALFHAASSMAQKVLLLCIDFRTGVVHPLAINQVDLLQSTSQS